MSFPSLDTALPAGVDAREHARVLRRVHDAALSGRPTPASLRPVVEDSWARVRRLGIDPDSGPPPRTARLEELQRDRTASPIAEVLPLIRRSLVPVADQADHIMLVTDAAGQILWRDGSYRVRAVGDRVGLVEGAYWNEASTGTNAIGTALAVGRPVQIYSAEHYVRNLHALTCACAPVHDPRDGRLLGAIDVTGPVSTVHPSTLALVHTVARLAEAHLQSMHHTHLERLRSVAAPLLAGLNDPALVVDESGWTATAVHMEPVRRVLLPRHRGSSTAWLPALGECSLEPLPGGWLVRPRPRGEYTPTSVTLDLAGPNRPWPWPATAASGPTGPPAPHRTAVAAGRPPARAHRPPALPGPLRLPRTRGHRPRRTLTCAPPARRHHREPPLPVQRGGVRAGARARCLRGIAALLDRSGGTRTAAGGPRADRGHDHGPALGNPVQLLLL